MILEIDYYFGNGITNFLITNSYYTEDDEQIQEPRINYINLERKTMRTRDSQIYFRHD